MSKVYVEATVSLTISKTIKLPVDDYTIDVNYDDEGNKWPEVDTSQCDLYSALDKITLPHQAYKHVPSPVISEELKGWHVDDCEVIREN